MAEENKVVKKLFDDVSKEYTIYQQDVKKKEEKHKETEMLLSKCKEDAEASKQKLEIYSKGSVNDQLLVKDLKEKAELQMKMAEYMSEENNVLYKVIERMDRESKDLISIIDENSSVCIILLLMFILYL